MVMRRLSFESGRAINRPGVHKVGLNGGSRRASSQADQPPFRSGAGAPVSRSGERAGPDSKGNCRTPR
jgi:hypothetical protein